MEGHGDRQHWGVSMSWTRLDVRSVGDENGLPILSIEDICVRYGGLTAVDGVTFEVSAGQVVGLIGPNGAGKSTLFGAISGHVRIARGGIAFRGVDITGWPADLRARLGLTRTFQLGSLVEDLTVGENIALGIDARHRSDRTRATGRRIREEALALSARYSLREFAHRLVRQLPLGIRRRVEVVRALAAGAKLVLLDEPGAGLTSAERGQLVEALLEVSREGVALLLTDHSTDLVFAAASRVLVMNEGRIVADDEPAAIRGNAVVQRVYLGTDPDG